MTQKIGPGLLILLILLSSFEAAAYYDEKKDELCREPKIQEFNLPEYSAANMKEVPAEAEFSFVVSGWANPKKIKVMAKDKPIPFTVESSDTFHKVKGKIPAEYTGKYIRLNVRIPAVLECYSTQGWLLKVAGSPSAGANAPAPAATPAPATSAPKTEPAASPPAAEPAAPKPESAVPPASGEAAKAEPQAPAATPAAPSGDKQTPPTEAE